MKIKTTRKSIVEETDFGVYLWMMPDGSVVTDDEQNYLSINAKKGDKQRIQQITDVAKSLGLGEGEPYFVAGPRKIDDEEYEYQKQRGRMGLVPDPLDVGALRDEMKAMKKNGRS